MDRKNRNKITNACAITVEGVEYESMLECSIRLGMHKNTVRQRVLSKTNHKEWNLKGERKEVTPQVYHSLGRTKEEEVIASQVRIRKYRSKKRGVVPPTYEELSMIFQDAGVSPLDKRYRLETSKVDGSIYLIMKEEFMTEEESRLNTYVKTKTKNCRKVGIQFLLTLSQVKSKLDEKGLSILDVGKGTKETSGRDFYQLCRVGDVGNYDMTSEFKTHLENIHEMYENKTGKKRAK